MLVFAGRSDAQSNDESSIVEDAPPPLLVEEGPPPLGANIPRMNGLQLVRKLRESEDPAVAMLPIIMLTARQGELDVVEGLKISLDDYVIKPFSPDELAARVQTALWRASKQRFGE
jgi:DNA-binding response OmpR family regulator